MKGTMVILESAAQHHAKLVVNASSSSVYSIKEGEKAIESLSTDSPYSVYAALKKSSELLCQAYHHLYGFGVINARLFSVYGPRGRPDQIVFKVVRMIIKGEPIPQIIPEPRRDFTFVSDIVNGLILTLKLPTVSCRTINLGSGSPRTITDVIRCVEDNLKMKAIIGETTSAERSDMTITDASFSCANELLGWRPQYTLETGIPEFVKWYLSQKFH